jgi:G:T/U-mismatch repair DNA glycosylase
MNRHYLLQNQNGILIRTTVKNWSRVNQVKFPNHTFENSDTTPTSEQIDTQLQNEGCIREMFNEDWYCYNPNEISENDLITNGYMNDNVNNDVNDEIKEILADNEIINIHPWLENYPIENESKNLIIGTHPPMPYDENNLQYFYGNMNEFWRLLDQVYPVENLFNNGNPLLQNIFDFQRKKSISITDIVYFTHVERFSTDDQMGNIENVDFNPFLSDWLENSIVETIYFTSLGGKNSAKNLFKRWLNLNYQFEGEITGSHINTITLPGNRKIRLIDLFSPSPTARRSKNRIIEFIEWSNLNNSTDYDLFRVDWYKRYLPL